MHYANIYYKFMKISPRLTCKISLFVISRGFPSKRRLSPVRIYGPTQSVSQSNFIGYTYPLGGGKRLGAGRSVNIFIHRAETRAKFIYFRWMKMNEKVAWQANWLKKFWIYWSTKASGCAVTSSLLCLLFVYISIRGSAAVPLAAL